jgi:GDSL-like lipase/acylhydrolase family protein
MSHVVLLGDSIFDNGAYTNGGPDVITQLRALLPTGWRATLGAVDGATTEDLDPQLAAVPEDATHRVLSVGGNDALGHVDLLERRSRSSAEVLGELADAAEAFEKRYRKAIKALLADKACLTVCTIYDGDFGDATFQRLASTALTVFNDAILRVAFEHGLTVIDLRLVCNEAEDYANPIEPSSRGGAKIARVIRKTLDTGASADGVARVHIAA